MASLLTIPDILHWADLHFKRKRGWPKTDSGPVLDGPLGDNWRRIDNALRYGLRDLPGHSSLAKLLAEHRGVRNQSRLPRLTPRKLLAWADAHFRRTGRWPNAESGTVPEQQENWANIDAALRAGVRGLLGGTSLAQLLEERRGAPNRLNVARLTVKQILTWADSHYRRTGRWPKLNSGAVLDSPKETWHKIEKSLRQGSRGLRGGTTLAKLLAKHRGVRNRADLPALTVAKVLRWALRHEKRTGKWPTQLSGRVVEAPGETWKGVEMALYQGLRGLPGGMTLAKLRHTDCRSTIGSRSS